MNHVYQERRNRILEQITPPGMAVIFSGAAPMRSADAEYAFSVDRNFYYLTGIDRPNMALVLKKTETKETEELYIEPYDEELAKWVGGRMKQEEAREISGIESIGTIESLKEKVHSFLRQQRGNGAMTVGFDLWRYHVDQADTKAHQFASWLKKQYPDVAVIDLYEQLAALRVIKSEAEIEQMKIAQKTTDQAIREVLSYVKPGMNECEIEGCFDFALKKQGVSEHAFASIVASGVRATTLHYSDNNQTAQDGSLVLLDLGSAHNHYCADISRTFPVNGRFTARQKELYQTVLEAQKRVIEAAKPGVTLKELNDIVIAYYEERLDDLNLRKEGKQVSDYYYHGVSHHLGLDTHDIGGGSVDQLQPGMVITVEPGIYIAEEGIGIRIEDDILITMQGAVNLSDGIIKEVDEIEAAMRE